MFKRVLGAALVLGAAALAPPAAAQTTLQACGPRDAMARHLEQKFGEHQEGAGLMGGNVLYELWFSESTGTWTLLLTRPGGTSCVMAYGEHWRTAPPQVASGDPA